jgi:hypothetical protein
MVTLEIEPDRFARSALDHTPVRRELIEEMEAATMLVVWSHRQERGHLRRLVTYGNSNVVIRLRDGDIERGMSMHDSICRQFAGQETRYFNQVLAAMTQRGTDESACFSHAHHIHRELSGRLQIGSAPCGDDYSLLFPLCATANRRLGIQGSAGVGW